MRRNECVHILEREAAPWRAQQRKPCHSIRRMRQCACQRQQILHDGPAAQSFNFDRAKANSGFLEPRYDFTEDGYGCAPELPWWRTDHRVVLA